jgi:hypothetical protein
LFLVARAARLDRGHSWSVLLRVAGAARFDQSLANGRVLGVHVLVAVRARGGEGLVLLVRLVAVDAACGSVHHDGRDITLLGVVATPTLLGLKRTSECILEAGAGWVKREDVTAPAVGVHAATKALVRRLGRVAEGALFFVAQRALLGSNLADGCVRQVVAARTLQTTLQHVYAVPFDSACLLPVGGNVDALAEHPLLCLGAVRASESDCAQDGDEEPRYEV